MEGEKIGEERTLVKVIRNMLSMGVSENEIAKVTDASIAEIRVIRAKMPQKSRWMLDLMEQKSLSGLFHAQKEEKEHE